MNVKRERKKIILILFIFDIINGDFHEHSIKNNFKYLFFNCDFNKVFQLMIESLSKLIIKV